MIPLLLAVPLLASCAALAWPASSLHDAPLAINLESRQLAPNVPIPMQCQNDCNPTVVTIISGNQCTAITCCSTAFDMGFFNCAKCLGQITSDTDYTAIQGVLDTLHNQCAAIGISIPKLTFPGQNPNRKLSSVASNPPPTATGSHVSVSLPAASVTAPSTASASGTATPTPTPTPTPSTTPAISQSTVTALPSSPNTAIPTVAQSTVTSVPSPTASGSAGIRVVSVSWIKPWGITFVVGFLLVVGLHI